MSFKDYSVNPAENSTLGDGTYIGANMLRNKVRPALQQLAADGKDLSNRLIPSGAIAGKFLGFDAGESPIALSGTGTDAALRTDLAGTTGSGLVGVKQTTYPHAPALSLHKWIENGVADAKRVALPSSFNFATDDAWQYLQNLVADVEAIGSRFKVQLSGSDTWRLGQRLVLNSNFGTGLIGFGGKPLIQWVGATHNTGTQDNATGAMIYFDGADHVWGGIENLVLFAEAKANFGVFAEGDFTPGFKIKDVHIQHAQLDCLVVSSVGTASPVSLVIESFTAYPYRSWSGTNGVCGRDVISLRINNSVGSITLRDVNIDNGVNSCVAIKAPVASGFAGTDILFDNFRAEQNRASGDIVVLDYAAGVTAPGTITFRNPKHALGAGGSSTTSFVRNKSTTALRPDIAFDPFLSNDAVTYVYKDDFDGGKTVPYVTAEHYRKRFVIEHSPAAGAFPSISRPSGNTRQIDATTASVTVTANDCGKRFTNAFVGGGGACTFNLPAIANGIGSPGVGIGFFVDFTARQAGAITLDAAGSDTINGAGTLVGTATVDGTVRIEVTAAGKWSVVSKEGF